MRIGLISDIHGTIDHLTAALDSLRAVPVDHILCAGDLVDYGDYPNDVVQRIMTDAIPCVQGNHDRMATTRNYHLRRQQTRLDTQMLDIESVHFLQNLPISRRFTWLNTQIFLAHSTPSGNDMYIDPDSPRLLLQMTIGDAKPADVLVLGHTHKPMWLEVDGTMIINPGSVYRNYSMDVNTCGVLSLPERDFTLLDIQTGQLVPLEKDIR